MQTVAFYSYKGGVGRTSVLSLAARWLAAAGRRVVALDFDWEAPGLHYKLRRQLSDGVEFQGGAVPYLLATARGAQEAPPLEEHSYDVLLGDLPKAGWLKVIPAGPAPEKPYWTALKRLQEEQLFTDGSGRGLLALLDFQARIEEELQPDYLLIDARTGVTELGSLATTLLADTVICLSLGTPESLEGTLVIVEALSKAPRIGGKGPIRLVPVICRLGPALLFPSPDRAHFDPELVTRLKDACNVQPVLMVNDPRLSYPESQTFLGGISVLIRTWIADLPDEPFYSEQNSERTQFSRALAGLFALAFPAEAKDSNHG